MVESSNWFKMPAMKFVKCIILLYGMKWLWIIIISFVLALTAGILFDLRFAILAGMILFILFPMELVMIYIYYGFRKECNFNVVNHRLILQRETFQIEMKFPNSWNSVNNYDTKTENREVQEDIAGDIVQVKTIQFPVSQLGKYTVMTDSIVIRIKNGVGFAWIPLSSFENENKFKLFIDKIIEYAAA